MPEITNVRVKFTRSKQPKEYESAVPEVELNAVLQPGEDHLAVTKRLMLDAATVVYSTLGTSVPKPVSSKLEEGAADISTDDDSGDDDTGIPDEPKPASASKPVEKPKPAAAKPAAAADDDGIPDDDAPAKPAEKPAAADDDGIPDDDAPTGRSISDNPEDRKNPEDDDGIPDDDAKPAAVEVSDDDFAGLEDDDGGAEVVVSPKEVQEAIRSLIKEKKLTVQRMKEVLAGHNVARVDDTTPEQRVEIKAFLDGLK